ncbi:MAG: alcohol dehydrogenase catalytic domain-containing protein [Thaumarchaeota archaeon]|nr:alcohol dehydrogenase catalytic domain-containing protein [Nitrososphaerota archaeon]
MRAVILGNGPSGSLAEVAELSVPSISRGELLVEMKACGLCGTDIEKLRGHYTAAMPVLGHEAVGIVSTVGEGVAGFKVGDRVFPHHHVPCGKCYYCANGSETMCKEYRTSNIDPGGFSEFFRVPAQNVSRGGVLKLPDSLGFEEASLIEPVACCIRAQERSRVRPGEAVLVVGAGPVGMTHALLLRSNQARVMISDVSEERLDFARKFQFELVLDPREEDVAEAVKGKTWGRGADLVITASGSNAAILQSLQSVRKGGRVCLFGLPPKGTVLDYDISDLFNSEVSVVTSYGATEKETSRAVEVISGHRAEFASLVTDRIPIGRFQEAVETATAGKGMKVLLTP